MKLGYVVKAGLLAGVLSSVAQAQSLTGNIGGTPFASATGVSALPVCDISSPASMLVGRSCTFSNTGANAASNSNIKVDGVATIMFNAGLNAYVYTLNYKFSGQVGSASPNVRFAFDIPTAPMFFNYGSSNISVSASVLRNSLAIADDAAMGAFMNVQTYNGATLNGAAGLDLNPFVSAVRPSSGPLPPNRLVVTDNEASGQQAINETIDRTVVGLGFDLNSTADRALFDGNGTVTLTSVVPEPSTYALFATGLVGLAVAARRRRRSV